MANSASPQGKPRLRVPRNGGDLPALRRKLWRAVVHAEGLMLCPDTPAELQMKALHGLVQAAATYVRLCEFASLLSRVERLEALLLPRNGGPHV